MTRTPYGRAVACLVLTLCTLAITLSAHAQQNDAWFGYTLPYGGAISSIKMWDDAGMAIGNQEVKTTDDGMSWSSNMGYSAWNIAVDTGGQGWMGTPTGGDYYTSNHGSTWYKFAAASPVARNVICFLTASPGKRFAAHYGSPGAYSRLDIYVCKAPQNNTWTATKGTGLPTPSIWSDMVANPKTGSLILSVLDSTQISCNIYRSTDDGDTWTQLPLTGIPPGEQTQWGERTVSCLDDGTMFTETHKKAGKDWQWTNWRSTDDGDTWVQCGNGLPAFTSMWSVVRNAAGTLFTTAFSQNDVWTIHFTSVFRSTDNGMNWTETPNAGMPPKWVWGLVITPRGTMLAHGTAGVAGGLYRSTDDGATWQLSVTGLSGPIAVDIAVDSSKYIYASLPESGVYRTLNGYSWTRLGNGIPQWGWINLRPAPDKSLYAADTINGVYHSIDNGNTWTQISSNLPDLHARAFAVSTHSTPIFFNDLGVYRSTNAGVTWQLATTTIPAGVHVNRVAVRPDGLMVAATDAGPYTSMDDGDTWTLNANGLNIPSCYAVGFTADGTILLGNANTIVRSSDNGAHWTPSDAGIVQNGWNASIFHAFGVRESGRIIASRPNDSVFIYTSTDNGMSWQDGRTGNFANFRGIGIEAFAVDQKNNLYAASTYGIWHATPEPVGVAEEVIPYTQQLNIVPSPNPANGSVSLAFTLPQTTDVQISLIDCLGREVMRTDAQHYDAGQHATSLATAHLATGMYRCVVHTLMGEVNTAVGIVR